MKLQWIIVSLVMLLSQSVSAGYSTCADSLQDWQPPTWHGTLQERTEAGSVYFLGEGYLGGKVYLVEREGQKHLIKKYRSKESLDNDIAAWDLLRRLLGDDPEYLIPGHARLDDLTLKMEYIPTADLHRLDEIEPNPHRISHWNEVFRSFVKKLQTKADKQHMVTYLRPDYFPGLPLLEVKHYKGPGQVTIISLKADNVAPVPGTNRQLLIFDPH